MEPLYDTREPPCDEWYESIGTDLMYVKVTVISDLINEKDDIYLEIDTYGPLRYAEFPLGIETESSSMTTRRKTARY